MNNRKPSIQLFLQDQWSKNTKWKPVAGTHRVLALSFEVIRLPFKAE